MPLSNPFRRAADRPTLRERAADLKAGLSRAIRQPAPEPASEPEAAPVDDLADFAKIEFGAYTFEDPVKSVQEWGVRLRPHAMAMHLADRTLRMTKPELIAFIREGGERDAETPAAIFHVLDAAGETFEGWSNLLKLAHARFIIAGAAEFAGEAANALAPETDAATPSAPDFTDQVLQAGGTGDVLAASGIDHRDGTVSYADATGTVVRRPMSHWIAFNAQQMHGRIQAEIGRRRTIEANHLPADDHAAWEAGVRCELRSDAVHALAFRHVRAFEAADAISAGVEAARRDGRDAELLTLAPVWEAAADLHQQRIDEMEAVVEAADPDGWPGRAPEGSGPDWQAWFRQKEDWRERWGITAAEEAAGDAGTALHKIELRIAELPAASLAGLKFKARVAQSSDDIGVDWPDNLGAGLVRDILAMTETRIAQPDPAYSYLVERIDFASATMSELLTIRDVADCVGSVAYAQSWATRCHRGKNAWGNPEYNAAGKLMASVGDALTAVESAAEREAHRRNPSNQAERETRLYMLAPAAIDNGAPDEIEAFARELLAHAEAERARG
ncbi:hypothetical protein [Methylobacterium sp. J-076]|uniref:hypothetical protein n=1 Tax=Methylobacterium sp. J-076 TaxID=2836655 RepID=UPI001FBB2C04|nr:hypothetical protein [Methylobacterium sp. J-076]MCJ2012652.1 hypothetical protein [Methylobacterium sp. J-076]